ncbi:dienelactone hydrolase [Variovorax boronicumulans]|uniref:alpha/beta hydrolase family protein n=1 Tax=Variovorax boronicumulans TaxID=436515 RepID=UPI00277FB8B4|nr:alpha/beta fold hydrolase [Variovorax boronicumulans]MDQ0016797.1 dienelactone hydrolase [Variovorax boronicumulans]
MKPSLFGAFLLGVCMAASAQTPWPSYIGDLPRAVSESSVAAELPPQVAALKEDTTAPAEVAQWSGIWRGWACRTAGCDIKLSIRDLTATGATVTYVGASPLQTVVDEAPGRFENDELQVMLKTGAKLVLRLRKDGDMELGIWRPETQLLSMGVLSRRPPAYVRRVEWLDTPFTENGKPVKLEMVIHRPEGDGPFPTLVMNHGSTGMGNRPEWFKLTWASPEVSAFFVARGWQVIYPQRRGRGRSDGLYDEGFEADRSRYSCKAALSLPGAEHALADLQVAMAHIRQRSDVDAKRIVIGGVSRGGILATTYAGLHPQEVVGAINFVGGWIGAGCPDAAKINGELFKRAAAFPQPTLWLYGEDDPYYPIAHSKANFKVFQSAGGKGTFDVLLPPKGMDGHGTYTVQRLWGTAVDSYLGALR